MTELRIPTTTAGKRHVAHTVGIPDVLDCVLTIEAEAHADERARLRTAVAGLPDVTVDRWCRAAVLALLDDPA